MPLESVANVLDDATHAELDSKILNSNLFRCLQKLEVLSSGECTLLLSAIASKSNGCIDSRYADNDAADELVQQNKELEIALAKALTSKSFKEIRNLAILQPPSSLPRNRLKQPLLNSGVQSQAISSAWNGRYIGEHHTLLLNNINQMNRIDDYSNSVVILQSSGTGKSRMVHEQSNYVFTLPFNLRPQSDSNDLAYPPPDSEIRNYLDWAAPDLVQGQTRYLHLLGHLFRVVSEELETTYRTKQPTYTALAKNWREYLGKDQNRVRMYQEAVKECNDSHLSKLKLENPPVGQDEFGSLAHSVSAVSEEAKKQLEELLQRIDNCCDSMEGFETNHVKLMLYFDEAHVLAERAVSEDPQQKDMYDVMCSCFNFFSHLPIFVIYLSTNSSIDQLAPPGPLARSARARANPNALQAPITETLFDHSPKLPIRPGTLRLEGLFDIELMAQFGRPLFWTLLAGAGGRKKELLHPIINLARAKLICRHDISLRYDDVTRTARTAVLDVLLNLNFEPRREMALDREAELVASHMRIVFSVPQHRGYLRSGYPSEPILAEAAIRQMDDFQTHASNPDSSVMASLLRSEFDSGILDQGQRGEVVFRLIISEAYRHAVKKDHPNDSPLHFSKGCKLMTFIDELFSDEYATKIKDSLPDNIKSPTSFSEAFQDAIIRFTHFGKMADDTGTTTDAMFAAFVRCMAFITWSSQEGVDLLIPVLLRSFEVLQESVMTGLIIQIKRRGKSGSLNAYAIDAKKIRFFPPSANDDRPYITLVAELGVLPKTDPAAITKTKVRDKLVKPVAKQPISVPKTPKKRAGGTISPATPSTLVIPQYGQPKRMKGLHPRYSIFAYGCSSTVYNVISQSDRNVFRYLLGNGYILDEHPRKDDETMKAVRAMKPFWSAGEACYSWIDQPFLHKYERSHDQGLLIGKYGNNEGSDVDDTSNTD